MDINENERKVSKDEAKQLADGWGAEYMEVGDKNDCKNISINIARKIVQNRYKQKTIKNCIII